MPRKLTQEEFIERAIRVHGDKYDYSKVIYFRAKIKVEIICKYTNHDNFWQTPDNHLQGQGCIECKFEKLSNIYRSNTQEFIQKAIKIHGAKFDYSKVDYKNNRIKIKIFCNQCKDTFWQTPNDHLNRRGCDNCGGSKTLTEEKFIEKARKIHGDKYFYPKFKYKNNRTKIEIICKKHTSFWQAPDEHLRGSGGCPQCIHRISKPETQWLNEFNIPIEYRQFKINIDKKWFNVDGYEPLTKTIYEFFGNYYHGNLKMFKRDDINPTNHKTYGELYDKTMEKIKLFQDNGYNVVYIWEDEFKKTKEIKND